MEECIICLEEKDDFVFFPCKHKICEVCYPVFITYSDKCPLCQQQIHPHVVVYPLQTVRDEVAQETSVFLATSTIDACKVYICVICILGVVMYVVSFMNVH